MGAQARIAVLALAVSCAMPAVAKEWYTVRDEHPETGSNINRAMLWWPVPPEARYAELSAEQQRTVKSAYVTLGANDEPAYPAYGMESVLREVLKLTRSHAVPNGPVHLAVKVDASGQPRGVAVLQSPDPKLAHAISFVLMRTPFKPARCGANACDSDYSFYYDFRHQHPHNTIVHDWHPTFWVVPLKPN